MSNVYWWMNKVPNLGDELAKPLLEHFLKSEASHAPLHEATFLTVGSILGWAWGPKTKQRKTPVEVIGSGFMEHSQQVPENSGVRIHSVRGYLTAGKLNDSGHFSVERIGDPGLFIPEVFPTFRDTPIENEIGVVLHYSSMKNNELVRTLEELDYKIIDIRTSDTEKFLTDLTSCKRIISESLHGLIISDAYGIPNVWLQLRKLHAGGDFKFQDYFSTIGRPTWLKADSISNLTALLDDSTYEPPQQRISDLQEEIRDAYLSGIESARNEQNKTYTFNAEEIKASLFREAPFDSIVKSRWIYHGNVAVFEFSVLGKSFALDVHCNDDMFVDLIVRNRSDLDLLEERLQQLKIDFREIPSGNGYRIIEKVANTLDLEDRRSMIQERFLDIVLRPKTNELPEN